MRGSIERAGLFVTMAASPRADPFAADANSGSPLVCTDYAGQTASMAAQRRGLHSARLHKLVRRMMAEREAELRLAAAS